MGKRLHTRDMRIESFELDGNKILVRGHLEDDLPYGYKNPGGARCPGGKVHDMSVEMEVSVPDFTVTAMRGHMLEVPQEDCRHVTQFLQSVVGTRIGGGFTAEVKKRLGRERGCTHLLSLILAIAPTVTMAYGAKLISSDREDNDHWLANSHVLNSCYMFREDGPYQRALKGELPQAGRPNEAS